MIHIEDTGYPAGTVIVAAGLHHRVTTETRNIEAGVQRQR